MESEYIAACAAAQEAIWLKRLLRDITGKDIGCVTIYEDNTACISYSKNPIAHYRSKHIDIRYHFLRQCVANQWVELQHIASNSMVADMLTKPLHYPKFNTFRTACGMTSRGVLE